MPSSDTPLSSLSRRERERRARREAMLRAAETVFAEKGYTHATLDEVAERAEFGKGTLYNYFEGGKEEILFAVLDKTYGALYETIKASFSEVPAERPLRERYRDLVIRAIALFQKREDLFIVLIKEAYQMCFSHDTEKVEYFLKQRERMVDMLLPALQQAATQGTIRDHSLHSVAHMLLENLEKLIVNRIMMKQHGEINETEECGTMAHNPEQAADFLTAMLFDGIEARPL